MASNATKKLTLVLAGDNKGAVHAVTGVSGAVGGLQGKLGGLGAGIAGAFSVGAVTAFTSKVLDGYKQQAGAVALVKRVTGESAKDSSLLVFAAQQAGVEATKAATSYGILATNIKNGKVAAEGIATKDSNGNLLAFGDIIDNIADKLHSLPPGFQRTAEARALFGRGGADLVKILGDGSAALEEERKKMQDLGLEFDENGIEKYNKFVHAQRDLSAAVVGVEVSIADKLIPTLTTADHLFSKVPAGVRNSVVEIGALAVAAGGLTLTVGALAPALSRGAVALHLKAAATAEATAATGTLAVAEVTEADAAIAEAAAQEALIASWVAGTPVALEQAAATNQVAVANERAATTSKEAATSGGLLSKALPIAAIGYVTYKLSKYGQSLSDAHASQDQLAKASKDDLVKLASLYASTNPKALVAIGEDDVKNLERMKAAVTEAGGSLKELDDALDLVQRRSGLVALGLRFVKDNAEGAGQAAIPLAESLRKVGDAAADQASKTFDAQQALAESTDTVVTSKADLEKAQKAATGNSDEYRSAVKQESDDLKTLAEDELAVTDAKVKATEAQGDLNDARKEAKKRLDDLRQSVIDTADAERDAATGAKRAAQELERKNADPRASALDREEAQNAAIEAQHKAAEAAQDHSKAIADNNAAQAAGVEGDKGVIDAKKKIADADDAIRQAEQKVKDQRAVVTADGVAKSKVIEQAVLDVKAAQDKVNDALLDQAGKYRDVAVATLGPVAGLQAYNTELGKLYDSLDPSSDLAGRVAALLGAIKTAISLDLGQIPDSVARGGAPAPGTPGSAIPPTRSNLRSGRSAAPAEQAPPGGITLNVTHINQGTPKQQLRAQAQVTNRELDTLARRIR